MSPALKIELFGTMRAFVDGEPLPKTRSRKSLWLLALLALRGGGPLDRAAVAQTLWPDAEATAALTSLRSVVSDLRQALGRQGARLLAPERKTLGLDLDGAEVDVLAFDAAIRAGELERAAGLYAGPLLKDCDEPWAASERKLKERACLDALRTLAEAKPKRAVALYRRAVEIAPLRDAPRRDLMSALVAAGDPGAALDAYRDFAQTLRASTNRLPDRATTELYVRLRTGERSPSVPKPLANGSLPHPITPFVGREDDRVELASGLETYRLVTLVGPGGVGKTRLAREVANDALQSEPSPFPDGAWFVSLEAVQGEVSVVRAIASTLRLEERPGRPPFETLVDALRERRLLLVLDNCEPIAATCALLSHRLLCACPGLRILATSREPLGVLGERVWGVAGLVAPDADRLPESPTVLLRVLLAYDSIRLFVERAAAASNFELTAADARPVAQICEMLDGLPLALELAATRTRFASVAQLAARLRQGLLDPLVGTRSSGTPRHASLRAVLDGSYLLLDPEDRRLFARLGVFVGGWTLEAAAAVAGATIARLESLVDKSLVTFSPAGRYGFLETVRQYACEKAVHESDVAEIRRVHARWYADLAERWDAEGSPAESLEREMGNFRVALDTKDVDPLTALRLAAALGSYWRTVRADDEGARRLREALAHPGALAPSPARAKALQYLGTIVFHRDPAAALEALREGAEVADALGDRARQAAILRERALIEYFEGDNVAAQGDYEASLALAREVGDRRLVAIDLGGLSRVWMARGDYAQARALAEESVAIFRELGRARHTAWALRSLGSLAHDRGDYAAMQTANEEALALFREAGVEEGVAWCLDDLGKAATETGRLALGEDILGRALRAMRAVGEGLNVASVLNSLGDNALAQAVENGAEGDFAKARAYQAESLAAFRASGHRLGAARALDGLGDVLAAQSDGASALIHYREAFAVWREVGDQKRLRDGLLRLGDTADDPETAARLWGKAHALGEAMGLPIPVLLQKRHAARLAAARSHPRFEAAWREGEAMDLEDDAAGEAFARA